MSARADDPEDAAWIAELYGAGLWTSAATRSEADSSEPACSSNAWHARAPGARRRPWRAKRLAALQERMTICASSVPSIRRAHAGAGGRTAADTSGPCATMTACSGPQSDSSSRCDRSPALLLRQAPLRGSATSGGGARPRGSSDRPQKRALRDNPSSLRQGANVRRLWTFRCHGRTLWRRTRRIEDRGAVKNRRRAPIDGERAGGAGDCSGRLRGQGRRDDQPIRGESRRQGRHGEAGDRRPPNSSRAR